MGMFSEELKILDHNAVQYMMDDMQETIDNQKAEIDSQRMQLADKDAEIEQLRRLLAEKRKQDSLRSKAARRQATGEKPNGFPPVMNCLNIIYMLL